MHSCYRAEYILEMYYTCDFVFFLIITDKYSKSIKYKHNKHENNRQCE